MGETNIQPEATQQQSDARSQGIAMRLGLRIFGAVSGALLRLLGATWRVEILGSDPRRASPETLDAGAPPSPGHLAGLFHESMLPCAWFFRDSRFGVAVSRSRDGDLIRATLLALGYDEPARGSSSRGGSAALRGLVRSLGAGKTVSVLVDGPRGPARVAKTGIVALAQLTNHDIQPVAFSARPALRLKSWDQSLIPLPFARVVCAFGDPIAVATEGDEEREQATARKLDERLRDLHHSADAVLLTR